jgi:hypothetical protein
MPLPVPAARSVGNGSELAPLGELGSPDQGAIIGGTVLDVILRLVRGMDSRLHPSSLVFRLRCSTSDSCTNAVDRHEHSV